jgi:hypothetical protein
MRDVVMLGDATVRSVGPDMQKKSTAKESAYKEGAGLGAKRGVP